MTWKARLVARGDMQKDIPDDPYSPTCRFETLRVFCSIAAQFSLKISDYDVQNAYLQSKCRDEIYVRPAPGQAQEVDGRKFAYRLNRSLYGAKRSGKFWNEELHSTLIPKLEYRRCIYFLHTETSCLMFLVFVDNILVAHSDRDEAVFQQVMQGLFDNYSMRQVD